MPHRISAWNGNCFVNPVIDFIPLLVQQANAIGRHMVALAWRSIKGVFVTKDYRDWPFEVALELPVKDFFLQSCPGGLSIAPQI